MITIGNAYAVSVKTRIAGHNVHSVYTLLGDALTTAGRLIKEFDRPGVTWDSHQTIPGFPRVMYMATAEDHCTIVVESVPLYFYPDGIRG
jgi:hypothetical protein